jgi:hypothetical protein
MEERESGFSLMTIRQLKCLSEVNRCDLLIGGTTVRVSATPSCIVGNRPTGFTVHANARDSVEKLGEDPRLAIL